MDPFASALEQAAAIKRREISPVELTRLYLDRIEKLNPKLNAYFLVTADLALEMAEKEGNLASSPLAGEGKGNLAPSPLGGEGREGMNSPLRGVPVSIKDLVALAGYPTTYGSRAYADFVTDFDQFPVARLKAA